ncbi:MAG TPA: MYXO-CTERM sorting domain-containing protein [Myxococcota bacterium]
MATRLAPLAVVVAAAFSPSAAAFSFLCNGVDASGTQELTDFCGDMNDNNREDAGDCTADNAAYWRELQVDFRFDDATRPAEETLAEWQTHQTQTMAAWNDVQGHTLTLRDAGAAQFRDFGVDNGENSIFWITNRNEFAEQVGSGINSILGVTLAPYGCGGNSGVRGGILDADIVMNGTGTFNWNDNSVVSTMAHEVGHAIGFGHPCTDCSSTALMSATSGFDDSDVPLFDDQQAIRALYPGEAGGLGTACTRDDDCDSNICITANLSGTNRSFCSQTCGTCTNGMDCVAIEGEGNVCVFSNAAIAGIGDVCGPPGCINECTTAIAPGCTLCVDTGANDTCASACVPSSGAGCSGTDDCSPFGCTTNADCNSGNGTGTCSNGACTNIGVCVEGGTALRNQSCAESACVDGLGCLDDGVNTICRGLCDANGNGCLASESCLFVLGNATQGVCIPGGSAGVGDSCVGFEDCGRGLLCLDSVCEQRCDRGFACDSGDNCVGLSGGTGMQVCTPGAEGEGEGEGEPGEGEGEGEPGECNVARGNFDCPAGSSCDDGDCVSGGEGPTGTFGLCEGDADCSGGLCVSGVCSRPCDVADGCPAAYSCDTTAIPGGLCVPDSCADDASICPAEFGCTYSSARRNVCAKGVTPRGCGCDSTGTSSPAAPLATMLLIGGLDVLRRRRRR